MLDSLNDATQEMKKFIDERNRTQEELKKKRNLKLRELLERLYKKTLKEERDDEAVQEMENFIEACHKAQEELSKEQGLKLTELIERLDNFRNIKKEKVISEKEEAPYRQEDIDKRISDIKKAAREVVYR